MFCAAGAANASVGRIQGWSGDELLVCWAIRRTTCDISSGPNRENIACWSVWQVTQPARPAFCTGVPGTLMSSSPFDSCIASFEVLVTFASGRSSWVGCAPTSTEVPGSV